MLPPGAFIGLGMMLAVKYLIDEKRKRRAAVQNVSVSVEEDGAAGKA
jgi:electron transport complex protein RnfE